MATNRSTKIIGRVYRNLKNFGISHGDLTASEILDEMQNAQDEIIARAKLEGKANIVLKKDVQEYSLTADEDLSSVSTGKLNIRSIKGIVVPIDWHYKPLLIGNAEFANAITENWTYDDIISNYDVPINEAHYQVGNAENIIEITQPLLMTVMANQLNVYPVPNDDYDGDILIIYAYLSSSITTITQEVEPEIPSYWDKAIELFASSQFVKEQDKGLYSQLFEKEIQTKKSIAHVKRHNLERKKAW